MAEDWSREEVEATVASYLDMLEKELLHVPYSKAESERQLAAVVTRRSVGALRYKLGNISAALVDLGKPYVDGFKPYPNYQQLLLEVTEAKVEAHRQLLALIETAALKPAQAPPPAEHDAILVDAPVREKAVRSYERRTPPRPVAGKDYLAMEARNHSLGRAGEEFVVKFEQERLLKAGRKALSERVEHVAVTRGDGLGYDVHSYDDSGRDRWIEVKTTRFGAMTPFYVTRREVDVSETSDATYNLYRLFKFEQPKLYIVEGPLRQQFELDPIQFSAKVR